MGRIGLYCEPIFLSLINSLAHAHTHTESQRERERTRERERARESAQTSNGDVYVFVPLAWARALSQELACKCGWTHCTHCRHCRHCTHCTHCKHCTYCTIYVARSCYHRFSSSSMWGQCGGALYMCVHADGLRSVLTDAAYYCFFNANCCKSQLTTARCQPLTGWLRLVGSSKL